MHEETKLTGRKGTILYIGGFELPDKNAAAHRVLSNAKLFHLLGYDTVFVGTDKSGEKFNRVFDSKGAVSGFVSYAVAYPDSLKKWVGYVTKVDKYLAVAKTIPDLKAIVCYNFPAVALERIRRYCRKTGVKCIADVTEWYPAAGKNLVMKIIKGLDVFLRMRIIQKNLDGLIVISRYLQEYYGKCRNVVYLPPLTDLSDPKWENTQAKSTDTLYLAYAGSPGTKDRIDLLIGALKSVQRKYHLDIVGIDKEAYLSMHGEDAAFLEKNEDIIFHGRVSHLTALDIVKRANYSCFFRVPDRVTTAGFPTKFAEAVSCGTPVITNRSSNIADYLTSGNGCLVEELTVEAISKLIECVDYCVDTDIGLFSYREYRAKVQKFLSDIF